MRRKRLTCRKKGLTLIEVAVSMVIIGIIAVTAGMGFSNAIRVRANSRLRQAALVEANSLMEMAFEAVDGDVYDSGEGYLNASMEHVTGNPGMVREFDGNNLDESIYLQPLGGQMMKITVTVSYKDEQAVVLEAYRYCE